MGAYKIMPKKRMTTTQVTDSDDFVSMSSAAQALYLHLNNGADDDGFNNQVQMAMFKAHASIDDLKILLAKRFILQFENGVIVIKHWRMANAIRKDRYTPTVFQEELKKLCLKDNGSYSWLPNGCQMVAVDKDSIGKNRIDKNIFIPPTLDDITSYCQQRHNNVNPKKFFDYYNAGDWKDSKGNKIKNWKQKIITWERNTEEKKQEDQPPIYDTSSNTSMSKSEEEELLKLMGKE